MCTVRVKNVVFIVPYSLSGLRVSVLCIGHARLSISLLQGETDCRTHLSLRSAFLICSQQERNLQLS